jgi:hypothetical protein
MAIDTVTGQWRGGRPALQGRAGAAEREASARSVLDEIDPGGTPVVVVRHRPAGRAVGRGGPVVCTDSHAPDLHGSRLTPRGRVLVALVWLVMGVIAALMVATIPGDGSQATAPTTKVMVEPGVTLWQLAGHVQPTADRHDTVATIMSLNDLESASQIRPGDILIVPVGADLQ